MKHKRLKSYLKLGILLFGISTLLTNCQKDLEIEPLKIEQSRFKTKHVDKLQIDININLKEKLDIITNSPKVFENKHQFQARNINNQELGIIIYTDQAKYLEDTSNGNHSYSLSYRA